VRVTADGRLCACAVRKKKGQPKVLIWILKTDLEIEKKDLKQNLKN